MILREAAKEVSARRAHAAAMPSHASLLLMTFHVYHAYMPVTPDFISLSLYIDIMLATP